MNYGKFFRLNKNLSRIEGGFAIYDYIDLPAYFAPSMDNKMSPKYPISLIITSSSVIFRLHYSAYKIEEIEEVNTKGENSKYPKYFYDHEIKKDDLREDIVKVKPGDTTKIVHMDEVVLELPYTNTVNRNLADTIKSIYKTNFPQIISKYSSTGGRYLEKLIRKRYPEAGKDIDENDVDYNFYKALRISSDESASYSTLWLMGLVEGEKGNIRYSRSNNEREIQGFLRKLMLDFMFDLKHSDVFQNSAYYQQMYSGLMSDFYFSALMHKCEYYYYRKITSQAINEIEDCKIDKKENKKRKSTITYLYANELIKAEDLWIKDIMSKQAEEVFEHRYPGKHSILRDIFEYYNFKQWPSWFAEPEEEMRRVCFTMKDKFGVRHICNADTLIRYLDLDYDTGDRTIEKMIDSHEDNEEQISKWFLKHYAFSDVLHLHWFKHLNALFLFLFALPCIISLFGGWKIINVFLFLFAVLFFFLLLFGTIRLSIWHKEYKKPILKRYKTKVKRLKVGYRLAKRIIRKKGWKNGCQYLIIGVKANSQNYSLVTSRRKLGLNKILLWVELLIFSISFLWLGLSEFVNSYFSTAWIALVISLILVYYVSRIPIDILPQTINNLFSKIIPRLHLLFPRLVASITLAWITLSMGFDLYVSYFDYPLNIPYVICIVTIVMLFVMYEINRITPHAPSLRKLLRSAELMIISYFISLSVGFVVINFLGEKYLERGGYISDYYTQHVDDEKKEWVETFDADSRKQQLAKEEEMRIKQLSDSLNDSSWLSYGKVIVEKLDKIENPKDSSHVRKVKGLKDVSKGNHKIAAYVDFWGIHIFVLRDFLIMFAFIAMFTGIFIQLIIFGDNKQMTEL